MTMGIVTNAWTRITNRMLKIENHKKLLGKELYGSGKSGSTYWKVTSIVEHITQYVIFIEQPDVGWERKISLHRLNAPNRTGYQYKLECGTELMYLNKNDITNLDTFSINLESFL